MSSLVYFKNIQKYLIQYSQLITSSNSINLNDDAVNAENIFGCLLNIAFGWNLVNSNEKNLNQDSFDLKDEKNGIYIQVTSNKNFTAKKRSATASFTKKHTDRQKKKHFIILFISPHCPTKILKEEQDGNTKIEAYDLNKLVKKIYYINLSPTELEKINHLLQTVVNPILCQFDTSNPPLPIVQDLPSLKNGLYVNRKDLVKVLFDFIQLNNGLLIAGHGYGKSFTLEELQRLAISKNTPCLIIRINDLISGSDDEINAVFKSKDNWLINLSKQNFSSLASKGILIFDAFDTAKEAHLRQTILKQIRKAINTLNPNWHILVSVRSFDASKSPQLHELFPVGNMHNNIICRYFEVPKLTLPELMEASKTNPKVFSIYKKATDELKELLRIPYFLGILEQILETAENVQNDDIILIKTEEQLLSFYWKSKASNSTANSIFLEKLTRLLAESESLSCEKSALLTEANSEIFDELNSKGVIAETSTMGKRIAYSHNILLDFAISRYLIPEASDELIAYISRSEKMPFLFRQAFIYFYSKLWQINSSAFWQHYAAASNVNSPLFRLYHQTILNYIAVDFYKSTDDLSPLFDEPEHNKKGQSIKKLLEAIRFLTKGNLRSKDNDLLLAISTQMHWSFLWEFGLQVDVVIKKLKEQNDPKNKEWKKLATIACNYWTYVLEVRKTMPQMKEVIENNGSNWGIDNLCAVYTINKGSVQKLIKQTLLLLKEEDFPIRTILFLGNNVVDLFAVDRPFGLMLYQTLYDHIEVSDKATYMGTAAISLKSNRRQDFGGLHHKLEADFPKLLAIDAISAFPIGLEIQNKYSVGSYRSSYRDKKYELEVAGISTYFTLDGSYEDIGEDIEYGVESFGSNIFKLLDELAKENKKDMLEPLVEIFIKHAHTCNLWRRFIRFLSEFSLQLNKIVYSLLCNETIFKCTDTTHEAAALLTSIAPHLLIDQRKKLEKLILNIKEDQDDWGIKYQNATISRLLNSIPSELLVTEESKRFVENHPAVVNRPEYRGKSVAEARHMTQEEEMERIGLNPANDADILSYKEIKKVEDFNSEYYNQNDIKFKKADFLLIQPLIKKFFKQSKNREWENEHTSYTYEYEITRAIKIFASSKMKFDKATFNFMLEIATFYLNETRYKPNEYNSGVESSGARSYSPNSRLEAVSIIVNLLHCNQSVLVSPMVLSLMSDNDPLIRFRALHALGWYWHNDRIAFWIEISERVRLERDGMCLHTIVDAVSYNDVIDDNVAETEKVAGHLLQTISSFSEKRTIELWSPLTVLLLRLIIRKKSKASENIIVENLNNKHLCNQLIRHIISTVDPHNVKNDYVTKPDMYNILFVILNDVVSTQFKFIMTKGLSSPDINDEFKIIHTCVQELYFVCTAGRSNNRNKELLPENEMAFYLLIKPILSMIVDNSNGIDSGFMVTHTGYYFMQLLNHLFQLDETFILSLAFRIVNCAATNGFSYDHSTLGEIIKLTEKILADHKHLLKEKDSFNNILNILDQFASSGWQEALELTWRLKEAF